MTSSNVTNEKRLGLNWSDGIAALAAVVVGAFGAFSYYGDTVLRPFAHTFGIWLYLVVAVSARQPPLRGALRGGGALALSVVAFFYGKQIYYDILYPGPGFPYRVHPTELIFWVVLGLLGGGALGLIASRVGSPGWLSAAAAALLMGLVLTDAYQWYRTWGEGLSLAVALIAAAAIAVLGFRSWHQISCIAILLVPGIVAGYFIVSVPDWGREILRL